MFRNTVTKACKSAWRNQRFSNSSLLTKTKLNSGPCSTFQAQLHINTRSSLSPKDQWRSLPQNILQPHRRHLQTNAFESLGIFPPLASNLKNLMDIETPTVLQNNFIPPILAGKDVLIRDTTGSGKTFGILLALLSKPRKTVGPKNLPGITSVVIVPNQELAFQIQSWVETMLPAATPEQIQGLIQVLVTPSISLLEQDDISQRRNRPSKLKPRTTLLTDAIKSGDEQIQKLSERLPHVLVATPARLWDLVQKGVLDLSGIDTIVMDEVDHLIRLPKRFASQREIVNRDRHPKPAELAVREIIRSIKEAEKKSNGPKDNKKFQIVAASATMNRPMRHWLQSNGWIDDAEWVDTTKSVIVPEGIEHHCLVIGEDSIRNMKLESDSTPWNERGVRKESYSTVSAKESAMDSDSDSDDELGWDEDKDAHWKEQQLEKYEDPDTERRAKRFRDDDDRILEGVATACLLDKVENACIFFCSSFSLSDLATRLEADFGVTVKPIQNAFEATQEIQRLSGNNNGRKKRGGIYIANESNARGLDLPGLSHVYIVGLPSAPSSYIHMAGRTGRMGKLGQVVTILRDDGHIEDRARSMFRTLNVDIKPFSHVE